MSINIEKLKRLNDLVSLSARKRNIIVLNPEERSYREDFDNSVEYDKVAWKIPNEFSQYINELVKDDKTNTESKILMIFEKMCKDYIYDDNLISYIKKVDDDEYSIPEWYGRDIDNEWESNRERHNRRVCYELARYLAKSLTELLKNNPDFNICIHWNKDLTHYLVGLTCSEYSITLDPDDFFNIKDLTRLKVGLTAQGIKILQDDEQKFKNALDEFNKGKSEYAIEKIEDEISENDSTDFNAGTETENKENEEITFIRKTIKILSEKYNMDSQGIFEYIKEIVDIKLGPEQREKVWKKIEGKTNESTRYIRCLILNICNQKFLIDVDEKEVRIFDEDEMHKKRTTFIPYKELSRGGFDYYDGT